MSDEQDTRRQDQRPRFDQRVNEYSMEQLKSAKCLAVKSVD